MKYCVCGHNKLSHYEHELGWRSTVCRTWTGRDYCGCKWFKQDNLRYLEDLYNERI